MGERDREILETRCRELYEAQFDKEGYRAYNEALYALAIHALDLVRQNRLYIKNWETGEIEKAEMEYL